MQNPAPMPMTPLEQIWKFPVHNNRSRFVDGGVSFFKTQSGHRANSLGRKVFSYADVKLVRSPPNSWNMVGTVVLETI